MNLNTFQKKKGMNLNILSFASGGLTVCSVPLLYMNEL